MSDALTDMEKDRKRERNYTGYLRNLAEYLREPSEEACRELKELAEDVDSIVGGYWVHSTSLSENFDEGIEKLKKGDKSEWGKLPEGFRWQAEGTNQKKSKETNLNCRVFRASR